MDEISIICVGFNNSHSLYFFLDILDEYEICYYEYEYDHTSTYLKVDIFPKNEIEKEIIFENLPPEFIHF